MLSHRSRNKAHCRLELVRFMSVAALFISCGVRPAQNTINQNPDDPHGNPLPQYKKTELKSGFGELEVYQIQPKFLEEQTKSLRHQELIELQLSSDLNTSAYILGGLKSQSVLLKPKVLLRSNLDGKRIYPKEREDGTVVIPVSIAFLDGLSSTILTGSGVQEVPEGFRVLDKDRLIKELESKLGQRPLFVSSIRCPDLVTLQSGVDGTYPIQFQSTLRQCPLNTFFPAQFVVRKRDWRSLAESFLYEGALGLRTALNISIPIVESIYRLTLSSEGISRELRVRVQNLTQNDSEIRGVDSVFRPLVKNFANEILNSFKASYPPELVQLLQSQVIHGFAQSALESSGTMPKQVQVQFQKEIFVSNPVIVPTFNRISDPLSERKRVLISSKSPSLLLPPETSERNPTFQSLKEGELLELRIKKLRLSEVGWDQPKQKVISNKVCIRPYEVCTEGKWHCIWRQLVPGIMDNMMMTNLCEKFHLPTPALPNLPYRMDQEAPSDFTKKFAWECTYKTSGHCDPEFIEDHWQRITSWSIPTLSSGWQEKVFVSDDWKEILGSLAIEFKSPIKDGIKETVCKASDLEIRLIPPDRIMVVMANTPNCQIFDDENRVSGFEPAIAFFSQVSFPSQFQCGNLIEQWDGKRIYRCVLPDGTEITKESTLTEDQAAIVNGRKVGIWKDYFPRAEIEGELRILGSSFQTKAEGL